MESKDILKQKLSEMLNAKDKFSKESEPLLQEVLKDYLNKYPEVKTISWTQYTPYFNDGEPCYFTYNNMIYRYNSKADVDGAIELDTDLVPLKLSEWSASLVSENAIKDLEEIDKILSNMQEFLEVFFGEGRIIVSRDKIEIEEYDHD